MIRAQGLEWVCRPDRQRFLPVKVHVTWFLGKVELPRPVCLRQLPARSFYPSAGKGSHDSEFGVLWLADRKQSFVDH